ncbi:DNA polymerase III subunit beta [Rosistilla oblonga]|uniref:DNA polymerase III subunit beta n=1 Tax=Rosistilla oblonga TaxID=2527990 RepID=UPI003A984F65
MKILCDRECFANAFQMAASVAPSRSPKAILQNVKVVAREGVVSLSATDMEIGINIDVSGVEIESEGAALLPVNRVNSILRECRDEHITFESTDSGMKVKTARSRFQLPSEDPDEFPHVESFSETKFHTVPTKAFRDLLKRTVVAADDESGRYALGGVLVEMEASCVTAVGTDGRRLATAATYGDCNSGHATIGTNTIVPSRSINLIERALSDKDETVDIAARDNDILIRSPRWMIVSRLVEGRYPNWRQVLPNTENHSSVMVNVGSFHAALRQAAIMTSQESNGIEFTFGDGTMTLEAASADVGESRVEMPIDYSGEAVSVWMDHRYVSDACKVLDAQESLTLYFESGTRPVLLTTEDGYRYVVMPMSRDR